MFPILKAQHRKKKRKKEKKKAQQKSWHIFLSKINDTENKTKQTAVISLLI